jgi:hypothetical protein
MGVTIHTLVATGDTGFSLDDLRPRDVQVGRHDGRVGSCYVRGSSEGLKGWPLDWQ